MRLMESGEVAKLADCSRDTVLKDADEGRLAVAFRTGNGRRLFADDVRCRAYVRYCDDFMLFADDVAERYARARATRRRRLEERPR